MRYRGMNGNATSYTLNVSNWGGSFVWCDCRCLAVSIPHPLFQFVCTCTRAHIYFFFRRRNFTADDRVAVGFRDWHASMTGTVSCHSSPIAGRWNASRNSHPCVKSHVRDFDGFVATKVNGWSYHGSVSMVTDGFTVPLVEAFLCFTLFLFFHPFFENITVSIESFTDFRSSHWNRRNFWIDKDIFFFS